MVCWMPRADRFPTPMPDICFLIRELTRFRDSQFQDNVTFITISVLPEISPSKTEEKILESAAPAIANPARG